MNEKIDFVILWVDGNDEKWLKEKNKYKKMEKNDITNNVNRYRDWDLLKYWFRGVEKYAPWVNKIHFVTYGHLPQWLDTTNPKINIVKHEDFIPKEYLPTFNSNVIQYYLHNIKDLTDKFVMFDDDMFILKEVKQNDFFKGDKICDVFAEIPFYSGCPGDKYPHSLLNNIQYIRQFYSKKEVYKKNLFKCFNLKYGIKLNIKTLFARLISPYFVGIYSQHICQSYTKKHYELFWKYCGEDLKKISNNKFRENTDLTTFLIRYIELLEGDFIPRKLNFGKRYEIDQSINEIENVIKNQKYNVICVNDSNPNLNFEELKERIKSSFENILPEKSSFEK